MFPKITLLSPALAAFFQCCYQLENHWTWNTSVTHLIRSVSYLMIEFKLFFDIKKLGSLIFVSALVLLFWTLSFWWYNKKLFFFSQLPNSTSLFSLYVETLDFLIYSSPVLSAWIHWLTVALLQKKTSDKIYTEPKRSSTFLREECVQKNINFEHFCVAHITQQRLLQNEWDDLHSYK